MSTIPNSAMPLAIDPQQAETHQRQHRRTPLTRAARLLAAPPLIALGLGVMAVQRLRRRQPIAA